MRLIAVGAVILAVLGLDFGAWWTPFVAGVVVGIIEPRGRLALPTGAGLGLLMWGFPLASQHIKLGLGAAAESLAAIMGFAHEPVIPVVLTLLVGLLLGLSGGWLGSAGRTLLQPAISR